MKKIVSLFILFLGCQYIGTAASIDTTKASNKTEEAPLLFAEQPAEFPGGQDAMYKFIMTHLKYPSEARKLEKEGNVFVSFVIDREGNVTTVKCVRDQVGYGCCEAAIAVVEAMPKWKPARQDDRTVSLQYTLPFRFTLTPKKKKT